MGLIIHFTQIHVLQISICTQMDLTSVQLILKCYSFLIFIVHVCLTLPTLEKIQSFWTWNTFKIPDRSTVLEQFLGGSEFDESFHTKQQEITFTSRFPLRASKLLEWLYSLIGFLDLRIYPLCDLHSLFAKHPL